MNLRLPFFRRQREFIYPPLFDWAAILFGIIVYTLSVIPTLIQASAYFDEGYSAYLANMDIFSMAGYTALDVHPPLYYAVLHVWQGLVGTGIPELRMLSVVFGWVAIVFGFLIVRRWFNYRAAWFAALLMSISPLFIRYGSAMRMYTMALAIALAGTYVLLRAVNSKSKWPWVFYAIIVAAGVWTNYFVALVWVTHLIWLLYEYRKNRSIIRNSAFALLGALVLYLPWLPWLISRYSDIQRNGFWIPPLSIDTLVSTVTQSLVFRSATDTRSWLVVGVIALIVALVLAAPRAYKNLEKTQKPVFRMLLAMSSLPAILLAVGSLPPLRSSYAYRYVLVAAFSSMLVIAIVLTYAKFKKHDLLLRVLLHIGTVAIIVCGLTHAVDVGNRNLDTGTQNKLGQAMQSIFSSGRPAPVVIRSPYNYYAVRLYKASGYDTHYIYDKSLANDGPTKPLYDHTQNSIRSFKDYKHVWLVGEDIQSVSQPADGYWLLKDWVLEHDDITGKVVAVAAYYERIN